MKRVDSFLICLELETGGIIVGWMYNLISLISIVFFILVATEIGNDTLADETLKSFGVQDAERMEKDPRNSLRIG
ncbi:CLUMA_CG021516, isoform A [Clunio marinus]|uniref:CLUMA_CG021516, isoform A n=1 Tax=Clunio marinus TaxID=568069 RepID=A0A1J1JCA7_9DIPT|nr:CLUMA_CG021516, isoform A [Clunio marinus]